MKTYSMKKKVRLEIIHDKDTGLTANYFHWFARNGEHVICEIANRYAFDGSVNPRRVLVWNAETDGAIAEFRRAQLEESLNRDDCTEQEFLIKN